MLASRRRLALSVLVLLLSLDLGRSLYARLGYAEPAEPWQSAPYEELAWPPGVDLEPGASLGERVYVERCAVCHGALGGGNGPAAPSMIPRPRDFTLGQYKYKSTPPGRPPSDEDLLSVVSEGLASSAMPYFDDLLDEEERRAVVEVVKSFSPVFGGAVQEPIAVPPRPTPDQESLARGLELYRQGCDDCHGVDGRGRYTPAEWKADYRVRNRDLTAPWTFRGGAEPEELWLRLSSGMMPGPMPSYAEIWSAEDRWHVVNYVASLARTPPWEPGGVLDGPGLQPDPVKRGEYLVHAEMCGLCHTQVNTAMVYSGDAYYLAGGMGVLVYPHAVFVSRNLTPDPETGLGDWGEEEIAEAIRNGRSPGRGLNLWGMPWQFLHSFEPGDALSIAAYLKQLPPVRNRIPLPLRYGFVETVIGKLAYSTGLPPIGNPDALVYKAGNYGTTEPGGLLPRDWPQRLLIGAQLVSIVVGGLAFLLLAPAESATPRRGGGWLKLALLFGAGIALAGLAWLLYSTPVLPFVPPEEVNRAVVAGIPVPAPDRLAGAEHAALVERGRYLYSVTSCAFCHGTDGGGGSKVSMRSFGTLWVSNITSDQETGIGGWSDRQIARAIRSGVSRDGRALHWQGMIWDHLSNLDEEDTRALIAYLRTLPAVSREVPAPRPPAADDCVEYTFYLVSTQQPGCE